jgi:hypothetical protein
MGLAVSNDISRPSRILQNCALSEPELRSPDFPPDFILPQTLLESNLTRYYQGSFDSEVLHACSGPAPFHIIFFDNT